MPMLNDNTLDNGLAALKAAATDININGTSEPATFTAATSGATFLGKKTLGAGAVFPGAIAAGSPSGRKITTAAVTDGSVTTNGTAGWWSITTNASSRLEAAGPLAASQEVVAGNQFSLGAFDIRLPNTGG